MCPTLVISVRKNVKRVRLCCTMAQSAREAQRWEEEERDAAGRCAAWADSHLQEDPRLLHKQKCQSWHFLTLLGLPSRGPISIRISQGPRQALFPRLDVTCAIRDPSRIELPFLSHRDKPPIDPAMVRSSNAPANISNEMYAF